MEAGRYRLISSKKLGTTTNAPAATSILIVLLPLFVRIGNSGRRSCPERFKKKVYNLAGLDNKIVPQHGRYLEGHRTVEAFLNWFEELECGTDLVDRKLYSLPRLNA